MDQQPTLYTCALRRPARLVAAGLLRLMGWRWEGHLPRGAERCVLIAAPHTSRLDLLLMVLVALRLNLNIRWLAHPSWFGCGRGAVLRWLGGLPVLTHTPGSLVALTSQALTQAQTPFQLVLSPQAGDETGREWRTGFYWIARSARVPVVLAYLDYGQRRAGIGPVLQVSGDIQADMRRIRSYYAPMRGRHAD